MYVQLKKMSILATQSKSVVSLQIQPQPWTVPQFSSLCRNSFVQKDSYSKIFVRNMISMGGELRLLDDLKQCGGQRQVCKWRDYQWYCRILLIVILSGGKYIRWLPRQPEAGKSTSNQSSPPVRSKLLEARTLRCIKLV